MLSIPQENTPACVKLDLVAVLVSLHDLKSKSCQAVMFLSPGTHTIIDRRVFKLNRVTLHRPDCGRSAAACSHSRGSSMAAAAPAGSFRLEGNFRYLQSMFQLIFRSEGKHSGRKCTCRRDSRSFLALL